MEKNELSKFVCVDKIIITDANALLEILTSGYCPLDLGLDDSYAYEYECMHECMTCFREALEPITGAYIILSSKQKGISVVYDKDFTMIPLNDSTIE